MTVSVFVDWVCLFLVQKIETVNSYSVNRSVRNEMREYRRKREKKKNYVFLIKFGIIQCQRSALLVIITETTRCSVEGFRFTLGDYHIRLFLKKHCAIQEYRP